MPRMQGSVWQPADRPDPVDDWTIDGARFFVCCRVDFDCVRAYHFRLVAQASAQQPVDGPDPRDDWTIVGTLVLVRCRVDFAVSALTLGLQVSLWKQVDRSDPLDDWTIVCAHLLVLSLSRCMFGAHCTHIGLFMATS
jgi:hypothetical protein